MKVMGEGKRNDLFFFYLNSLQGMKFIDSDFFRNSISDGLLAKRTDSNRNDLNQV
jgi:hypothetical protein